MTQRPSIIDATNRANAKEYLEVTQDAVSGAIYKAIMEHAKTLGIPSSEMRNAHTQVEKDLSVFFKFMVNYQLPEVAEFEQIVSAETPGYAG
jgi:hypothetical protein